jgi:molybdopterin molybdotransferase
MDGYAVCISEIRPGRQVVASEVRIGHDPGVLADRAAVMRVVTGGGIPTGADAVIRREDVIEHDDGTISISAEVIAACRSGTSVRRKGENGEAGRLLPLGGREITAPVAAALATNGSSQVRAHRRVRVAIIVTGDELVGIDEQPGPWQIRESNGSSLMALLSRRPWLEATPPLRVKDNPDDVLIAAKHLLSLHDCLLFTGAVSMGHRDFVPSLIRQLGARVVCHRLPQRPGKPILLAEGGGKLIAGLPGNPLSVMATARRIVLPILSHVAGAGKDLASPRPVSVASSPPNPSDLWLFKPVILGQDGAATMIEGGKGSGDVVSASISDGFIEVKPRSATSPDSIFPLYEWDW